MFNYTIYVDSNVAPMAAFDRYGDAEKFAIGIASEFSSVNVVSDYGETVWMSDNA